jgi:hypothetical protein
MRRSVFILVLVILSIPGLSSAQQRGFGLGIILGEPTGISFKSWTGSKTAVDGGIAWSFEHGGSFHLHVDYLIHNFRLMEVEKGQLAVHYGIGGRIRTRHRERVGVRIPVGLSYFVEKAPVEIFLELGPVLDLAPATEFRMTGGVGFRYYF